MAGMGPNSTLGALAAERAPLLERPPLDNRSRATRCADDTSAPPAPSPEGHEKGLPRCCEAWIAEQTRPRRGAGAAWFS